MKFEFFGNLAKTRMAPAASIFVLRNGSKSQFVGNFVYFFFGNNSFYRKINREPDILSFLPKNEIWQRFFKMAALAQGNFVRKPQIRILREKLH